jgi:integrase
MTTTAIPTLAAFLEQWLADVIKPGRKATTYETYLSVSEMHIIPALGRHKIDSLTPLHVQRWIAAKHAEGMSATRLRDCRAILRAALNQAIKWGLIARNVVTMTELPKSVDPRDPSAGNPLTPAEATALLRAAHGDRLEPFLVTALYLGLRHGELRGLRWQDVDFDRRELHIEVQLQKSFVPGEEPKLIAPKTKSSRQTLPMPGAVYDALTERRRQYAEDRLLAGGRWKGDKWGLVFASTVGTPLNDDLNRRRFRQLLTEAGIERRRLHDLRHSTGTFLVAKGVNPRVVQQILRHGELATTMGIYAHVETDTMRAALESLDNMREGAG